jgi:HAT1-interacting factor 1
LSLLTFNHNSTQQLGENAPETADLYFSYGRALLENAIVQNSVLGKEQREDAIDQEDSSKGNVGDLLLLLVWALIRSAAFVSPLTASGSGSGTTNAPILSFSGDAEEMDDGEDHAVDLFGKAAAVQEEEAAEAEGSEGEEDDVEPEDDFNAAWEVLDLARAIYDKQKNESDDEEVRLKLADTYIALGDVSLETGLCISIPFSAFFDWLQIISFFLQRSLIKLLRIMKSVLNWRSVFFRHRHDISLKRIIN